MFKSLRVFALLLAVFSAADVMAAGYVCEDLIEYTSCEPGFYMTFNDEFNATPAAGNACTECPMGYSCAGGLDDRVECPAGSFTGSVGATTCSTCPTVAPEFAKYVERYETDLSLGDGVVACRAILKDIPVNSGTGVLTQMSCYVTSADSNIYNKCEQTNIDALHCDGGYYGGTDVFARSGCSFGADGIEVCSEKLAGSFTFGDVANAFATLESGQYCVQVGDGYYSPNASLDLFKCPDGETTIGFGDGADEAGDCGIVMHVGDEAMYLRSEQKTWPSLNVLRDGKVYYANMSVTDMSLSYGSDRKLRVSAGDMSYWVHDESTGVMSSEHAACIEVGASWQSGTCVCPDGDDWFYRPAYEEMGQVYDANYRCTTEQKACGSWAGAQWDNGKCVCPDGGSWTFSQMLGFGSCD